MKEIDRQYEANNNADLDNGVYHKFVYSSEDGEAQKHNSSQNKHNNYENEEEDDS